VSHYFDSKTTDYKATASCFRKCVICDTLLESSNELDICTACQIECERIKKILNYLNIHNETDSRTDDLSKGSPPDTVYQPAPPPPVSEHRNPSKKPNTGTTVLGTDDVFYTGVLEDESVMQIKNQKANIFRLKTNERILLDKQVFVIGKSKNETDFWIQDNKTVSRKHVQIITKPDGYFLMDANSMNGTYLSGNRLKPFCETPLSDGDKFYLSDEEFAFVIEEG
jgi:pSer/pThr/pTyr-binding forkhead associated (FHA) protein